MRSSEKTWFTSIVACVLNKLQVPFMQTMKQLAKQERLREMAHTQTPRGVMPFCMRDVHSELSNRYFIIIFQHSFCLEKQQSHQAGSSLNESDYSREGYLLTGMFSLLEGRGCKIFPPLFILIVRINSPCRSVRK